MLRFLFFLLLAYIFISALKAYFVGRRSHPSRQRGSQGPEPEDMVLDPQCGTYIPRSEAFLQGEKYFCSQECAKLFLSREHT
jgi:uncharacterized protein